MRLELVLYLYYYLDGYSIKSLYLINNEASPFNRQKTDRFGMSLQSYKASSGINHDDRLIISSPYHNGLETNAIYGRLYHIKLDIDSDFITSVALLNEILLDRTNSNHQNSKYFGVSMKLFENNSQLDLIVGAS